LGTVVKRSQCVGPVNWCQIEGFRNWGIEGLKANSNKLKEIEFLQFLNSKIRPISNFHSIL